MDDLISISREKLKRKFCGHCVDYGKCKEECFDLRIINSMPTVKPTLYGYKIEHLAYIATVMEKEGVTAEYAVRTFDDMERVLKMLIEEVQAKVEEALNG